MRFKIPSKMTPLLVASTSTTNRIFIRFTVHFAIKSCGRLVKTPFLLSFPFLEKFPTPPSLFFWKVSFFPLKKGGGAHYV